MHRLYSIVYEGLEHLQILVSERSSWKQLLVGTKGDCYFLQGLGSHSSLMSLENVGM